MNHERQQKLGQNSRTIYLFSLAKDMWYNFDFAIVLIKNFKCHVTHYDITKNKS